MRQVSRIARSCAGPLAALAASFALLLAGAGTATAAGTQPPIGVFVGGGNVAQVAEFGTWLGRPMTHVLDYLPRQTWSDITDAGWLQTAWQGTPYTLVLCVPMLPEAVPGVTLQQGASGAYDTYFADLAADMVAHGLGGAVIRLGWEFNGNWYKWSAAGDPAAYRAFFRRIVDAMRAVPGASFRFEWAPVMGAGAMANVADAYPGDAYVDYVGMSLYDVDWAKSSDPAVRWQHAALQPFGLPWLESFAAAHGKQIVLSEWGVAVRDDGSGGGDNAYFVARVHEWLVEVGASWSVYFEYDAPDGIHVLSNGQFPASAATFRELFGPNWVPPVEPPPAAGGTAGPEPKSTKGSPAAGADTTAPSLAVRVVRLAGRRLGVRAWASDAGGVRRVDVLVNGRRACRDRAAPFRCRSGTLPPGRHVVRVAVLDLAGNRSVAVRRLRIPNQ